jgi:pectinesterase
VFASKGLVLWAEDSSQYLALGKTNGGSTFSYYAGAGWTRSGDFATVEDWNRYLDTFAVRVRNPLLISVSVPR